MKKRRGYLAGNSRRKEKIEKAKANTSKSHHKGPGWATGWRYGKASVPYQLLDQAFIANRDRLVALVEEMLQPGEFGPIEKDVWAIRRMG